MLVDERPPVGGDPEDLLEAVKMEMAEDFVF